MFGKNKSIPNATTPGKRRTGHDARAFIEEAARDHEHRIRGKLMYVKFGDDWVSIEDTAKIERIMNGE